jgi:hypothetical protein
MIKWLLLTCFQETDLDDEDEEDEEEKKETKEEITASSITALMNESLIDSRLDILEISINELKQNLEYEKQQNVQMEQDIVTLQNNVEELKSSFLKVIDEMKELIIYIEN